MVARWQLIRAGLSEAGAECLGAPLAMLEDRRVPGTGWGSVTQRQRWVECRPQGSLEPSSANASAAVGFTGISPLLGPIVTVTRVGTRGAEHSRGLHVGYSLTLRGDMTERDGLPVTTVERTIIDLWPQPVTPRPGSRMLREALRLVDPRHACRRRSMPIAAAAGSRRCGSRWRSSAASGSTAAGPTRRRGPSPSSPMPGASAPTSTTGRREGADLSWPAHASSSSSTARRYHVLARRGYAQEAGSGRRLATPSGAGPHRRGLPRARALPPRSSRVRTSVLPL